MGVAVLFKWMCLKDLDFVYDGVKGNNSGCQSIRLIVLKSVLNIPVVLRVKLLFTHQTTRSQKGLSFEHFPHKKTKTINK